MQLPTIHILLADDDKDDCLLFQEALNELSIATHFEAVHDGEKLMKWLHKTPQQLPDVLFLDLNMPRKNGFQCLGEIKSHELLKKLTVIVFSTSFVEGIVTQLHKTGAQYYIRKPGEFQSLKQVIQQALGLISINSVTQPDREHFVLNGELKLSPRE